MKKPIFCTTGDTAALRQAKNQLLQWGYDVESSPKNNVTHLILPVPSFETDGNLKGNIPFDNVLSHLPQDVIVFGGNLPALPRKSIDFLKDEYYLAENATITAHCTMDLLTQRSPIPLNSAKILLIGWGRIGKQLSSLLKAQGMQVTVAARNPSDLQTLSHLGYLTTTTHNLSAEGYDIIINTVPAPILDIGEPDSTVLKIDLASNKGIIGKSILWARGLPNQMAPDLSGILIAKTALRYALGKEPI